MMVDEEAGAFDLSDLDSLYETAEPPEQGAFTEVPDGTYQARVDKAELATSQQGNRMLKWQLRILSGPHANRVMFKTSMLESADNLRFLKGDLAVCGVEIGKLSDLPSRLGDLLDITLEARKVRSGEFSNVYFQRRIVVNAGAPGSVPAGAGTATGGLTPF